MTEPPAWIRPMAATLTERRFAGPEWTFERKFDGIRLIAFKRGAEVALYSRSRRRQQLPPIADAVARLPAGEIILDGELTWSPQLTYHIFDLVWIDGCDLQPLPLDERRIRLRALPLQAPLQLVAPMDGDAPWEHACREGWEGVIAKRRDAPYEQRRSPHWMKMKCELTAEFLVGGFTDPQGSRVGLGALLVGHHHEGEFVFAGRVGTGFDTRLLLDLRARLAADEIPRPPFTRATGLPRIRAHWVQPRVRVKVAFIEWTVHGKLRHSRLLAVHS